MNSSIESRLQEQKLDPRGPNISRDLDKYHPQDKVNSVSGLIDLIRHAKPKTVVEVGCFRGVSTECFALLCEEVTAIDLWTSSYGTEGDPYKDWFLPRIQKYSNVKVIKGSSAKESLNVADNSIDLVYIDADHSYESAVEDILNWMPKVKSGGFLTGHDYVDYGRDPCSAWMQVFDAVNDTIGIPDMVFSDSSWMFHIK